MRLVTFVRLLLDWLDFECKLSAIGSSGSRMILGQERWQISLTALGDNTTTYLLQLYILWSQIGFQKSTIH